MKKIETLFLRGHETGELDKRKWGLVVPILRAGFEWVLAGEGIATEKIDGSACAVINGALFKRRHLKADPDDKSALLAAGWHYIQSGIWWQPTEVTDKWHHEAFATIPDGEAANGTYELVGPKIQGNPYHLDHHELWRHGAKLVSFAEDQYPCEDVDDLFSLMGSALMQRPIEGIVWHRSNGEMAKLKRVDYGIPWPPAKIPKKMERGFWKDVEGNVP